MAESADRDVNHRLRARFDAVHDEYRLLRSGLDDLQRQLAELRISERSDDGLVTATVGARGQVVAVEVDAAIYRDRDAKALGRKITETINRAAVAATGAAQQLIASYLPSSSGTVDFLRTGDLGALLRRADAVMSSETPSGQDGGRHHG